MYSCRFLLIHLFFFINITSFSLLAQRYELSLDAKSRALGGAYSSVKGDAYSTFYNPATIYFVRGWAGAGSLFNPFSEEQITVSSASVIAGFNFSAFAFSYDGISANPIYEEWTLSWHHGFPIVPSNWSWDLALGWGVKYGQIRVGYNSAHTEEIVDVDIGLNFRFLKDKISIALAGNNLIDHENNVKQTSSPSILRAGVSTTVLEDFLFAFDVSYELGEVIAFHFGQEWSFVDIFFLRVGVASEPISLSLGLGVRIVLLDIDYVLSWQPELGLTQIISAQFKWIDEKEVGNKVNLKNERIEKKLE